MQAMMLSATDSLVVQVICSLYIYAPPVELVTKLHPFSRGKVIRTKEEIFTEEFSARRRTSAPVSAGPGCERLSQT